MLNKLKGEKNECTFKRYESKIIGKADKTIQRIAVELNAENSWKKNQS